MAFNLFFPFGGRPTVILFPPVVQYGYDGLLILVSSLWFHKTWKKNYEQYKREASMVRQLKQLVRNKTPHSVR
jgi:hypothetical protein